jgi:hypothetical protein
MLFGVLFGPWGCHLLGGSDAAPGSTAAASALPELGSRIRIRPGDYATAGTSVAPPTAGRLKVRVGLFEFADGPLALDEEPIDAWIEHIATDSTLEPVRSASHLSGNLSVVLPGAWNELLARVRSGSFGYYAPLRLSTEILPPRWTLEATLEQPAEGDLESSWSLWLSHTEEGIVLVVQLIRPPAHTEWLILRHLDPAAPGCLGILGTPDPAQPRQQFLILLEVVRAEEDVAFDPAPFLGHSALSPDRNSALLQALGNDRRRWSALVATGIAQQAPLTLDLTMSSEPEMLEALARSLEVLLADPADQFPTGWAFDQVAFQFLIERLQSNGDRLFLRGFLQRHVGVLCDDLVTLRRLVDDSADRPAFDAAVIQSNRDGLRSISAIVRLRGHEWLDQRSIAAAGFDPLASAEDRDRALNEEPRP